MRLISARIQGYGRLVDATIKLDQKVIAVVGPNEAGKTTLLNALAHVESDESVPLDKRSRASSSIPDNASFVSLRLILDDDDRDALSDLDLADPPQAMMMSRKAGGGAVRIDIEPAPATSETVIRNAMAELAKASDGSPTLRPLDAGQDVPSGDEVATRIDHVYDQVTSYLDQAPSSRGDPEDLVSELDSLLTTLSSYLHSERFSGPATGVRDWLKLPHPGPEARDRLWKRSPDFYLFSDADRSLASAYTLDDKLAKNKPQALVNLARLADLDLDALINAAKTGQVSRRDTMRNQANKKLDEFFRAAWRQSNLAVVLNVEGSTLRIGVVEDGVFASVLNERSAGLRMFVALTAFLATRETNRPKILLVDEAENHLHIDAQADLVQMFAAQDRADKVIYTTHSPACLPADLGVGIRAVVVDGEETSHVENSFWRNAGGFSPLLFAMGAAAAAFTPARCAIIAEGASDMLLLPTLIRDATGLDRLDYQVAPGLAEVPADRYTDLDFEAAKIAFLVDSDAGGQDLTRALAKRVPMNRIIELGVPGAENLLDPAVYADVYMEALREDNPSLVFGEQPKLGDLRAQSWAGQMRVWSESQQLTPPSKVRVATMILNREHVSASVEAKEILRAVHCKIAAAMGLAGI
jgi:energy-coupling factor transporter ATP-binding protein EcfA2